MSKTFHLTIAKVGENLYDADAQSVVLPGMEGEFEVLASHEAFVSELKEGTARIVNADGVKQNITIPFGAIAEISSNQATVLI